MIDITHLSFSYTKHTQVLHDISLVLPDAGFIALIGKNGSGKSTLLSLLAGQNRTKKNTILLDKIDITQLKPRAISRRISYLPQHISEVHIKTKDLVAHGNFCHKGLFAAYNDSPKIYDIMEKLNILDLCELDIATLSSGQRQKAYLAMSILQDSNVLLLDEPFSNLDIKAQLELLQIMKDLSKKKLLFVAMHQLDFALSYATKIAILQEGKLTAYLPKESTNIKQIIQNTFDIKLTSNALGFALF